MEENKFYTVRGYQMLDHQQNGLTASLEDYLEMIYRNMQSIGYVRVSGLAQELNVKPSSVSKMIMKLAEQGYIDYEKYGVIKLTKKGTDMGKYLLWRHNVVNRFFSILSPQDQEKNFEEAEQVEHILSLDTVKNIEHLLQMIQNDSKFREQMKEREENK